MSAKKYHVSLTETERDELLRLSKSQHHSERERKRARILLLADEAKEGGADKDTDIAAQVKVAPLTVNRIRQRFAGRMNDKETLQRQVAAWQDKRNTSTTKIDWRFTTADARIKLKKLYPTILPG